jgi:hypothetical protein
MVERDRIGAAQGDLLRVEEFLSDYVNWTPREDHDEVDGLICDVRNVFRLLGALAAEDRERRALAALSSGSLAG